VLRHVFAGDFGPQVDRHLLEYFTTPTPRIQDIVNNVTYVFHRCRFSTANPDSHILTDSICQ
jgi:hypothetical protein